MQLVVIDRFINEQPMNDALGGGLPVRLNEQHLPHRTPIKNAYQHYRTNS